MFVCLLIRGLKESETLTIFFFCLEPSLQTNTTAVLKTAKGNQDKGPVEKKKKSHHTVTANQIHPLSHSLNKCLQDRLRHPTAGSSPSWAVGGGCTKIFTVMQLARVAFNSTFISSFFLGYSKSPTISAHSVLILNVTRRLTEGKR